MRHVPSQWIEEARRQIAPGGAVLGFSFGAYIAVSLSRSIGFRRLIIASLSPYFAEDTPNIPDRWRAILGKRRIFDTSTNAFPTTVSAEAIFLVGGDENPILIDRSKRAFDAWYGPKKLVVISGVGHQIDHPAYAEEIIKAL